MGNKYNGTQRKTEYNGFLYDSQLEAQWAVFYNDVAISAVPHPATFKTGKLYQGKELEYTPDFYLPEYKVFCEVKATDDQINDCDFQRKVSAAMDHDYTPVANGLLILGPMSGFSKSETKRCLLQGEYYKWHQNSIRKSYWKIGRYKNIDNGISFSDLDNSFYPSVYPRFAQNTTVVLYRNYESPYATEIVYKSIFNAIYAKENGLFTFKDDTSTFAKETEIFDDDLSISDEDFDDWSDGKPW